jgi:predicted SnoaL-like aldol condensation-catalyzing enzyme
MTWSIPTPSTTASRHATYRFKDGKLVEEWETTEDSKLLTAPGLLPELPF